jgi:hypothetical protein
MAGQQSSSGDIHQVQATKQAPDKKQKQQVNESASAQPTLTRNGDTYYLIKVKAFITKGTNISHT